MAYDPHATYRGDQYLYSGIMQGAGAAAKGIEDGVEKTQTRSGLGTPFRRNKRDPWYIVAAGRQGKVYRCTLL